MNIKRVGELLLTFSLGVLTTLIFTGAGSPLAWPVFGVIAATGLVLIGIARAPAGELRDEDHQATPIRNPTTKEDLPVCLLCAQCIQQVDAEDSSRGWEHV